jgi:hypothetical protein
MAMLGHRLAVGGGRDTAWFTLNRQIINSYTGAQYNENKITIGLPIVAVPFF